MSQILRIEISSIFFSKRSQTLRVGNFPPKKNFVFCGCGNSKFSTRKNRGRKGSPTLLFNSSELNEAGKPPNHRPTWTLAGLHVRVYLLYIFYIAIRRMCVHVNIYIYKYSKSNAETHTYIIYHVFHQFSYHHCLLSSHLQYHRFPYIFPTFSQAVFFSRDLLAAQLNKGISDMPG